MIKDIYKAIFIATAVSALSACGGDSKGSSETTKEVTSLSTKGANILAENNSGNVWRFAVIPDTQGAYDDDYTQTITHTFDNITLSIKIGYDVNNDGIFDGEGWKIDVSDPYNTFFADENGDALADGDAPVAIASNERSDNPYDFKHLPSLMIEPIITKIKSEGVSIVLAVGDMTDLRTENEYVEWMDKVATPLTEAGITVLPVRGNHEVVDGNDWLSWFTTEVDTTDPSSVNNMDNDIDAYTDSDSEEYDQGYNLYQQYPGTLLTAGLASGDIVGYEGIEDLMYYTIQNNTLFIAIDFYASDLVSVSYEGTWLLIYSWLKDVLEENSSKVDHIVMFGHEALSTKKRPSVYDYDEYFDYISSLSDDDDDESTEPGILGLDTGQLGYLALQDESSPGLMNNVLNLLSEYKVNYIAGHDHQYSRSMIHPDISDTSVGFTQIVAGNASWKAYNNRYGVNSAYETGLAQDNFVQVGDYEGTNSQYTKQLTKYEKSNKISFVIVEVNDRQITFKNYYAPVNFSEADLNMGTYWDEEQDAWVQYDVDATTGETVEEIIDIEWSLGDTASYTSDALQRIVSPYESYWTTTSTPDEEGYIGTEAAILDGYNLTYNSVEVLETDSAGNKQTGSDVNYQDELGTGKGEYTSFADTYNISRNEDAMNELLSLSWFADNNETTVSDILFINGNLNQDGSYKNTNGFVQDTSPSELFYDKDAVERDNPTNVIRDGVVSDNDQADAITLAMTAPEGAELSTLTIGRYNETSGDWEEFLDDSCFTATAYSDDFSVMYGSGTGSVPSDVADSCATYIWGYNYNNNTVWGFTHQDGRYALIVNTK